ncbi:MAG: sugar phosphate nucleotidyltransferase, partial [Elusimicrobiota bacterium]
PTKEYCVSTGIYVFNKRISKFIPRNCYLDFPRLINILISKNEKIKPFFFREKWLDIGNPDDYRLANKKSSPFCIK